MSNKNLFYTIDENIEDENIDNENLNNNIGHENNLDKNNIDNQDKNNENNKKLKNDKNVTNNDVDLFYEELMEQVNAENKRLEEENEYKTEDTTFESLFYEYQYNYLKPDLMHVARYYDLKTRKKTKIDLITDIVEFELNPENIFIVEKRKYLWNYIEELKEDDYLSQFISF